MELPKNKSMIGKIIDSWKLFFGYVLKIFNIFSLVNKIVTAYKEKRAAKKATDE